MTHAPLAGQSCPGAGAELPFVSVVIPVRNEQRYLRLCLEAVLAQDYPVDRLEVIVVDGRSADGTVAIVHDFARTRPQLRLLDEPGDTIPRALNLGIRAARGRVIVRVDGHTVIAPDYVRQCVQALEASGADNVGGPRRTVAHGFWGRAIVHGASSPFGRPGRFHRSPRAGDVETVFLGAFRRETLDRVGLFDESLLGNEDFELNYRIRQAGGRVFYSPAIKHDYYSRDSLAELARFYWHSGRVKGVVLKRHPRSLMPRQVAAPLLLLALLGALVRAAGGRPTPLLAVLATYGGALFWFSRRAASGGEPREVGAVALVFATMHFSWGAGLLAELLGIGQTRRSLRPVGRESESSS